LSPPPAEGVVETAMGLTLGGGATVALACVGLRKRLFARGRAPPPDLGPPAWMGYRRVGPPLLNL
jgi:hypothetical protein